MGSKAAESKNEEAKVPQGELKVYGDYFNSDTRTILCCLKMSAIEHRHRQIDTLKNNVGLDSEAY